jgi:hypothetical protein
VKCPGGATTCRVTISQVHLDKVPMAPPNGTLFMPPAWTIQPHGVHFTTPARMTIPNNGLAPGRIIDMFQFDHDLNMFVNIGKGTVSQDGLTITTDPGFGITAAGWGGGGPPPPPRTCASSCDDKNPCTTDACENGSCVHTPLNGVKCDDGSGCSTAVCRSGACVTEGKKEDGSSCDDEKFCTENDKCVGGSCKGEPKKGEALTPAIKIDKTLDDGIVKITKAVLQKLGITKKVEAKAFISGVRKKVCCEEKQTDVTNIVVSLGGELEVEIFERQLLGPTLPLPPPLDTGVGLFLKGKISGNISAAPLTKDNCKDEWQGSGSGAVGAQLDLSLKAKISEIVSITPLAATTGVTASCTVTGTRSGVVSKCTGTFNGVALKSEIKFFNQKITLVDAFFIQPSQVGPFETIINIIE